MTLFESWSSAGIRFSLCLKHHKSDRERNKGERRTNQQAKPNSMQFNKTKVIKMHECNMLIWQRCKKVQDSRLLLLGYYIDPLRDFVSKWQQDSGTTNPCQK
jgi:hypothetical protein